MGRVTCEAGNPYSRSVAAYNGWETRRRKVKKRAHIVIADWIMSKLWREWDDGSGAHNFWKRKVRKYKKSLAWWKKNYLRVSRKLDKEEGR